MNVDYFRGLSGLISIYKMQNLTMVLSYCHGTIIRFPQLWGLVTEILIAAFSAI